MSGGQPRGPLGEPRAGVYLGQAPEGVQEEPRTGVRKGPEQGPHEPRAGVVKEPRTGVRRGSRTLRRGDFRNPEQG